MSDAECPDCGKPSPLFDWDEVDVGIGVIRGNYEYKCPDHGCFAFCDDGQPSFRDRPETWGLNRAPKEPTS